MDSSWLLVVSIASVALAPLWAKLSNRIIALGEFPRPVHVAGVSLLSVAMFAIFLIGPWVLMAAILGEGRLAALLYADRIGLGAAILFGPGITLQIVCAVAVTSKPSRNSRTRIRLTHS